VQGRIQVKQPAVVQLLLVVSQCITYITWVAAYSYILLCLLAHYWRRLFRLLLCFVCLVCLVLDSRQTLLSLQVSYSTLTFQPNLSSTFLPALCIKTFPKPLLSNRFIKSVHRPLLSKIFIKSPSQPPRLSLISLYAKESQQKSNCLVPRCY
jgi:hypothetical protein